MMASALNCASSRILLDRLLESSAGFDPESDVGVDSTNGCSKAKSVSKVSVDSILVKDLDGT